jgi:hypothetical protein
VVVKACGNLKDWETIATGVIGEDGVLVIADPESINEPKRFYRIGKVDPP